jgi:hypothetical protein
LVARPGCLAAISPGLVLIGEVGFSSNPRTVVSPFGGGGSGDQPDMEAQLRAYTATVQALGQFQDLAGAYWWAWEPRPRAGGALDATFTPQNKPALGVLTEWLHDELRGPAPVAARP